MLLGAASFFVMSVTGRFYHYLPLPNDWSNHKSKCIDLYKGYENSERLVSAALTKHLSGVYESCGSINGEINARKASYVFSLVRCLVVAAISTVIAFGIFFISRLDKNLVRVVQRIEIINPLNAGSTLMSLQKPPPPPSPPPVREIKEDRPTPSRPQVPSKPGISNVQR